GPPDVGRGDRAHPERDFRLADCSVARNRRTVLMAGRRHGSQRHRRSALGTMARGVLGVTLALMGLLGRALVSVNLPPVRAWMAEAAARPLATTFRGRVVLRAVSRIAALGVPGADVQVFDPEGRLVAEAANADVRLFLPGLLWDVLVGTDEPLVVRIDRVAVEQAGIRLIDDGTGTPSLARTFEPRNPGPKDEKEGAPTVVLEVIELGSVRVRGALAGYGSVQLDLRDLGAAATIANGRTDARLERVTLDARRVPVVDTVRGTLSGAVTLPESGTAGRRARATIDARVAGSPLLVTARLDGDELEAVVRSPALEPSTLRRLAPALAPDTPVAFLARGRGTLPELAFDVELTQGAARIEARGTVVASDRPRGRLSMEGSAIDLAALLRDGPRTELGFSLALPVGSDAEGLAAK